MYDAENHPLLLDNICTQFLLMGPFLQYVCSRKRLKIYHVCSRKRLKILSVF